VLHFLFTGDKRNVHNDYVISYQILHSIVWNCTLYAYTLITCTRVVAYIHVRGGTDLHLKF